MSYSYDLNLVTLSVVIACTASYTALDLMAHMHAARGKLAWLWLICGAVAMGSGIWSMHFVGMLAFRLPVHHGYDLILTLLSLSIAIIISGCALWLMRFPDLSNIMTAIGSGLIGLGIAAMHYCGMMAMQMRPPIDYNPWLAALSVLFAILASYLSLHTAFRRQNKSSIAVVLFKLISAVEMGGTISAMHYIGMAAARFAPGSVSLAGGPIGLDNLALAAIVALITFLVLMMTLATSAFDSHLSLVNAKLANSLRAANEELQTIAFYDNLTGLPGRLLLEDRLNQAIYRAERHRKMFACLLIDLNKFKPVNDTFGHRIGDLLLKAVAHQLRQSIRNEDTAARLGGDEFVVVLNGIEAEEDAGAISQKILDSIKQEFHVENQTLTISCSIGISLYPQDGKTPDILMAHADKAMYNIKHKGGYAYFNSEIR